MKCSCQHEITSDECEAGLIGTIRDEVECLALCNCPECGSTRSFVVGTAEADRIDAVVRLRKIVQAVRAVQVARLAFASAAS